MLRKVVGAYKWPLTASILALSLPFLLLLAHSVSAQETLNDVSQVGLQITKIVEPVVVPVGGRAWFTMTATYNGESQTQNVWMTDTVPYGLEILDVVVMPWRPSSILPGNTVVVDIGTLDPFGSETVTVIIRVRGNLAGTWLNVAEISSDDDETQSNTVTLYVGQSPPPPPLPPGPEVVPEPGSILLLGSGLAGLAGYATLRLRSGQALRWRTRE